MLRLLTYLLKNGVVTEGKLFPPLAEGVLGLPELTDSACLGSQQCQSQAGATCQSVCPTEAIKLDGAPGAPGVEIDLGACIACGLCTAACPTGTIVNDSRTQTAVTAREDLVLRVGDLAEAASPAVQSTAAGTRRGAAMFARSIALRVVSTGCSACDLEISAAGNPIFDMERFGVHVVASPRFADALLVTGPVPKAMHDALKRCYDAMSEPRLVIACGSCAISGGVHKHGYAEANGVGAIIPVDVFIPGCPPHPWSIIYGVQQAMNLKVER